MIKLLFLVAIFVFFLRFLPRRFRGKILLVFSASVIGFLSLKFLFLLFFQATTSLLISKKMLEIDNKLHRKYLLWIGLVTNLGVMVTFKYFDIILNLISKSEYLDLPKDVWLILIPISVSFYIFTILSFLIDVYYYKIKKIDTLTYLNYVTYFPKIFLGPIERYNFFDKSYESIGRCTPLSDDKAIYWISIGLFKKYVIAASLEDFVFEYTLLDIKSYSLLTQVFNILDLFYIYADFSGAIDIIFGCSMLIGINLSYNFYMPYFSKNPIDFWSRWHISLVNWLKDYVYYPVALRSNNLFFGIIVTFFIMSAWHSTTSSYFLWGAGWIIYYFVYYNLRKINFFRDRISFHWCSIFLNINIVCFINYLVISGNRIFSFEGVTSWSDDELGVFEFYMNDLSVVFMTLLVMVLCEYFISFKSRHKWTLRIVSILLALVIGMKGGTSNLDFYYLNF